MEDPSAPQVEEFPEDLEDEAEPVDPEKTIGELLLLLRDLRSRQPRLR